MEQKFVRQLVLLFLLAALAFTVSCKNGSDSAKGVVSGKGKVEYVTLGMGFYGIRAEDGKQYEPQNLAPEFQSDGLQVKFELKVLPDVGTIYMWGTPVEVVEIKKLR